MANIENIPVPLPDGDTPYHYTTDRQPLVALEDRISLVNDELEIATNILQESIGSAGSLSNRLNQSIEDDGSIKTIAIDEANHSIASHTDDSGFVRMTDDERSKLDNIATGATNVSVEFDTISTTYLYDDGLLEIGDSDTTNWRKDGTKMVIDVINPLSFVKHYNVVPITDDYTIFTLPTSYSSGTLRVYVNGVRIIESIDTYVPIYDPVETSWIAINYSETSSTTFTMSETLTSTDLVVLDFDEPLT